MRASDLDDIGRSVARDKPPRSRSTVVADLDDIGPSPVELDELDDQPVARDNRPDADDDCSVMERPVLA